METGKTKPLYYKRIIWLKSKEQPKESIELVLDLLKDNTYIFKSINVVVNITDLIDFRHTKNAYEYFEQLKLKSQDNLKTLCVINYESPDYIERDVLLSRVTKLWTNYSTVYLNCEDTQVVQLNYYRAFNYIINNKNPVEKLSCIVQDGKYNETDNV